MHTDKVIEMKSSHYQTLYKMYMQTYMWTSDFFYKKSTENSKI